MPLLISTFLLWRLSQGVSLQADVEQEISLKKMIAEAKMTLLSLKKDSWRVKGSKWPENWAAITQEGPKCPKNWDRNDYKNGAEMTWLKWPGSEMACVGFG